MIVARLAEATLRGSSTSWRWLAGDYDRIRDKIADVVEGFEDFNTRVHRPGGFYLGNAAAERRWLVPGGRARFETHAIPRMRFDGDSQLLRLTTIRSHDQYNTTIYGLDDRYRGVSGERRVCFISAADLAQLGFSAGQWVDLVSIWHDGERIAKRFLLVEYDLPTGCLAAYYPETNPLVPLDSHADRARTPTSKSIPVRLRLSKDIAISASAS